MRARAHTHTLARAPLARSSVPSGRVGAAREAAFRSNDHFRDALAEREAADVSDLEGKMGRK
jgi:hypothetical protein